VTIFKPLKPVGSVIGCSVSTRQNNAALHDRSHHGRPGPPFFREICAIVASPMAKSPIRQHRANVGIGRQRRSPACRARSF